MATSHQIMLIEQQIKMRYKQNQMNKLQDILNTHLPSGVLLTGEVNSSVLKAMQYVADMKNIDENYTHLSICLDRSGSMSSIKSDILGGLNTFLAEQRKVPGKLTVSLIQFDNHYEEIYSFVDIKEVVDLTDATFVPRGGTALNDSFSRLINETKAKISAMPGNKPGRVLFISLTDGEENASREISTGDLKKQIQECEKEYKWIFSYIGAEQDSFVEGGNRGIVAKNSLNFEKSSVGVKAMYDNLSFSTTNTRSANYATFDAAFNLQNEQKP